MRRVAVTGIGAVTPVGNDVETTWQSLIAGRSGVGRITTFDPDTYKVRIAGLVKDFDLSKYLNGMHGEMAENLGRAGSFGLAAAVQALRDARIEEAPYEPHERGLSMGASVGRPELKDLADMLHPIEHGLDLYRQPPSVSLPRDPNLVMEKIAELGNCQGPMISVSTACTASAHSVGEAFRRIQDGDAKLMISGGFDALTSWLDVLGFALLGALTDQYNDEPERGSRPFSADRSGFVLGEGSVVAVLEDLEEAQKRGAHLYAEVAGYGSSMNAYRITDAPPDGGGAIVAMGNALSESGLGTDEVDYVAAHGTGTPGNDFSETFGHFRSWVGGLPGFVGYGCCAHASNLSRGFAFATSSANLPGVCVGRIPPALSLPRADVSPMATCASGFPTLSPAYAAA